MQPDEFRKAGETIAALEVEPGLRDWRAALACALEMPLSEVESYASGERRVPKELGQRMGKLLEELGRHMSEPGRLAAQIRRRNDADRSHRSSEERQHGPLTPPEAEVGEVGDDEAP
jgi:hypothetical protein